VLWIRLFSLVDVEWRHATDSDQHCLKCLKEEAKDIEFDEFADECG
jgi:hypothetical protein